jgi:hypothetical protein
MTTWSFIGRVVAIGAIVLCGAGMRAQSAGMCDVPGYCCSATVAATRDCRGDQDKTLNIVVLYKHRPRCRDRWSEIAYRRG